VLKAEEAAKLLEHELFNISYFVKDIEVDNIDDEGKRIRHFNIKTCKMDSEKELESTRMLRILPGINA